MDILFFKLPYFFMNICTEGEFLCLYLKPLSESVIYGLLYWQVNGLKGHVWSEYKECDVGHIRMPLH